MKNLLTSIILAIAAGTSLSAQAALVTYTDRASFLAASSGFTTIDFDAQNPAGPSSFTNYNPSLNIGSVTFNQAEGGLYVFGGSYYFTLLTSSYLSQDSGFSGINVSFANPVYGVGMDLGIPFPWDSPDLSAIFNLSNGDTVTTTAPQLTGPPAGMNFFGFYSDTAFSSFNLNGPSHALSLDDLSFTSQAPQAPQSVPEPATLALLGLGLYGIAASRRRRK
jgi:hypothetical protein